MRGAGNRALAISKSSAGAHEKTRLWFGATEVWYDGAGDVSKTWAHVGFAGQTIRVENRTTTEFQHQSALGHMLASVDADGAVEGGYAYGPFGEVLDELGDGGEHSRRFNGKEADAATGLSYYGYRYYDPLSVTWTQADPFYRFVPDSAYDEPRRANLYQYTLGNSIRGLDPNGLGVIMDSDVGGSQELDP